ncbi:hypothetical protein [uncultured Methylobacterium sp.]|jgi:hypothetical protein|uniref:hypothetical protein n=1 Tax=uncultured Methylobacterium sp. TaxID=157278 RepID=UPI00262CBAB0|nr:hypothetical protein [uncultured Methylobacterium sp.]
MTALLLGLVLVVWAPALMLALGLALAHLTGCRVDEAGRSPCVVAGLDIGGLLHTLTVMGWLVIPMLPFMLISLLLGLGAGAVALLDLWRG